MQRKGPRVSLLPRTAAFSPTSLHGSLRGVGGIARSILPCMRFALGTFKKDDIVSVEDAASCLVLTVNLIAHLIRNHAPHAARGTGEKLSWSLGAAMENVDCSVLAAGERGILNALNELVASTKENSRKKSPLTRSDTFEAKLRADLVFLDDI